MIRDNQIELNGIFTDNFFDDIFSVTRENSHWCYVETPNLFDLRSIVMGIERPNDAKKFYDTQIRDELTDSGKRFLLRTLRP